MKSSPTKSGAFAWPIFGGDVLLPCHKFKSPLHTFQRAVLGPPFGTYSSSLSWWCRGVQAKKAASERYEDLSTNYCRGRSSRWRAVESIIVRREDRPALGTLGPLGGLPEEDAVRGH